jgi:acetyl esterase
MKQKLMTGSVSLGLLSMAAMLSISSAQDPGAPPADTAPRDTTRPDQPKTPGNTTSDTSSGAATSTDKALMDEPTTGQGQANAQLDPQVRRVLDELNQRGPKPFEGLSAADARKQPSIADAVKRVMKDMNKDRIEINKVEDIDIKLSDTELDGRVYRPAGDGPFPVILYIHGGGWVVGDLDAYDASPRAICKATDALVISTEYRQGPEDKFPAAHNDAFGAYQWTLQNAGRWGGDAKKVAVVGESAGGNLAASVSIMAQDKGMQMPIHQVLIYPITDTKMDTPSYRDQANAQPLNAAKMKWFFDQVFAKEEDRNDPKVALLQAKTLKGMPPTTIITAQFDPLRSEGEAFAKKLQADGVPVQYKNYDGLTHEFFTMSPVVDKAQEAVSFVATNLKDAFAGKGQQAQSTPQGQGQQQGQQGTSTSPSGDRTGSTGTSTSGGTGTSGPSGSSGGTGSSGPSGTSGGSSGQ